ncbi:MAG: hypothetical protein AB1500_12115 [Bacillota bacterium]
MKTTGRSAPLPNPASVPGLPVFRRGRINQENPDGDGRFGPAPDLPQIGKRRFWKMILVVVLIMLAFGDKDTGIGYYDGGEDDAPAIKKGFMLRPRMESRKAV